MKQTRKRVFPKPGKAVKPAAGKQPSVIFMTEQPELEVMIDGFCEKGVDIHAYFTPNHARKQICDLNTSLELAALEFLRRKQRSCAANISYYDFSYPNALTLEGVLTPVKSSQYYRPDGHPRPTVGLLMAARMFGSEFPADTPTVLKQDFGVDLISHPNAEDWLLRHTARCQGDWGEDGYAAIAEALEK
jgi:hypothetical protein